MKTIIFGINDDETLSVAFSRIDLTNVLGQYLDTLEINGDNYLITKVLKSRNEANDHRIDVREIAQDTFPNGKILNYSNIEKSEMCVSLERLLNNPECKEGLRSGLSVREILDKKGIKSSKASLFDLFKKSGFQTQPGTVTSVAPHLFENLKNMNKTNRSLFDMYCEMMEIQKQKSDTKSL